jgi:hypothetical protein
MKVKHLQHSNPYVFQSIKKKNSVMTLGTATSAPADARLNLDDKGYAYSFYISTCVWEREQIMKKRSCLCHLLTLC